MDAKADCGSEALEDKGEESGKQSRLQSGH